MGTTSHLTNFNEVFNGLDSRVKNRVEDVTGSANARRINVNADYGATWQLTPKIALNDIFDFWYFRQPATNVFTETDYAGTSMLQPPGAATTTTTPDYQALNQKTKTNTFFVNWDVNPFARLTLGYRYRSRIITDAGGDFIPIHENWSLFGIVFRPTPQLRANFNFDWMYADNSFTRISPRQLQHYVLRTNYKAKTWLTFSGTINILEDRDNIQTVNHLAHDRDFSFSTVITPERKMEHRPELFVRRHFLDYARVLYRNAGCSGHPTGPRCVPASGLATAKQRLLQPADPIRLHRICIHPGEEGPCGRRLSHV